MLVTLGLDFSLLGYLGKWDPDPATEVPPRTPPLPGVVRDSQLGLGLRLGLRLGALCRAGHPGVYTWNHMSVSRILVHACKQMYLLAAGGP